MAEYIEREALPQKKERGSFLDDYFNAGWNACLNNIESIPAADVAPVRHGKWMLKTFDDGYGEYQLYECDQCGAHTAQKCRNYCHNCGAKMEVDNG